MCVVNPRRNLLPHLGSIPLPQSCALVSAHVQLGFPAPCSCSLGLHPSSGELGCSHVNAAVRESISLLRAGLKTRVPLG